MPIAQIWKKARVSSPYVLESVETCVSDKIKIVMHMTRYAQNKEKCTDLETPVGPVPPDQSDRSGPANPHN
jgi:hypothetical protein